MEEKNNKKVARFSSRYAMCSLVLVFSTAAFSCCFTAEFHKVKAKDMKFDGSLCSLPKSDAFGLGIAAIICISITQVVGTTISTSWILSTKDKTNIDRITSICFLLSSWATYGLTVVMSGTAASMNGRQVYGKGWMDGDCYLVRNGVFGGAAALVILNALLILGFTSMNQALKPSVNAPSV
ncbi:hypothetical protein LUZ60_016986 [Juncus effusus]|nr:hypothetical protein LUZ60_016986 [Juncus effusus]